MIVTIAEQFTGDPSDCEPSPTIIWKPGLIADTGARVSLCGTDQAKGWNLLHRMTPSKVKIKP